MNLEPRMFHDFAGRSLAGVLGMLLGSIIAFLTARWRRHRQHQELLRGNAQETIVIEHHLVETALGPDGEKIPATLRLRSLGQAQIEQVIPNGYLATELLQRSLRVTPRQTLISMDGAEGSYLLETLTSFVGGSVSGATGEHDSYVLAPACEPDGMALYQPITLLLISVSDLTLFEDWSACQQVQVEHGSDGTRVLTLMRLAQRFRAEHAEIMSLRRAGLPTTHRETCYILDLALDKRFSPIPTYPVPWGRFGEVLNELHLDCDPVPDQELELSCV